MHKVTKIIFRDFVFNASFLVNKIAYSNCYFLPGSIIFRKYKSATQRRRHEMLLFGS